MKNIARVLLTLVIVAAGCVGGYELWDYYLFSPWTRDARVQADVVSIAPDVAGFVDELRVKDNQSSTKAMSCSFSIGNATRAHSRWPKRMSPPARRRWTTPSNSTQGAPS